MCEKTKNKIFNQESELFIMATKSLFEAYKNRLNVANTVHAKMHGGEGMSNNKKLVTAKALENVNR